MMCKHYAKLILTLLIFILPFVYGSSVLASVKGIYITQSTMENTDYINYLIQNAKSVGINTFVVDLEIPSKKYQNNIKLLKENQINYVARITIFPGGGTAEQVASQAYWEKKYRLVQYAINYGADQIQLDYIRYNTKQHPSSENAKNILKVISWYKNKLIQQHIPLQIDVFGVSSFGESRYIGQNVILFSQSVDAICPMVYPSHYDPYLKHAVTPYQTVFTSLKAIKAQFKQKMPVRLYAYIEISNYRYPLTKEKRVAYVNAEMRAVRDAGADGWFVWSAHNRYDFLFQFLKNGQDGYVAQAQATTPSTKETLPPATKNLSLTTTNTFPKKETLHIATSLSLQFPHLVRSEINSWYHRSNLFSHGSA